MFSEIGEKLALFAIRIRTRPSAVPAMAQNAGFSP